MPDTPEGLVDPQMSRSAPTLLVAALAPSPPIGGSTDAMSASPLINLDYSNTDVQRMTANVLNVFNGSSARPKSGPCPVNDVATGPATD